jgi:hypothetical protein
MEEYGYTLLDWCQFKTFILLKTYRETTMDLTLAKTIEDV